MDSLEQFMAMPRERRVAFIKTYIAACLKFRRAGEPNNYASNNRKTEKDQDAANGGHGAA